MWPKKKQFPSALVFACCYMVGSYAFAQDAMPPGYGVTKESAIEVCKPDGERAYLARLVCPDSSHPNFERVGSMGMRKDFPPSMSMEEKEKLMMAAMGFKDVDPDSPDHHIVDGYSVKCGGTETILYLDMYHCSVPAPANAPDGFTIIN